MRINNSERAAAQQFALGKMLNKEQFQTRQIARNTRTNNPSPTAIVPSPNASRFQSRPGGFSQKSRNRLTRGINSQVRIEHDSTFEISIRTGSDKFCISGLRKPNTMTVG